MMAEIFYIFLMLLLSLLGKSGGETAGHLPINSQLSDSAENLFKDYWEWKLRDFPQFGTYVGIHTYDHLLDDMSEGAFQARYDKCLELLKRAEALSPGITDEPNRINIKILIYELEMYINSYYLKGFYLQTNYIESVHGYIDNLFKLMLRKNLEDYDKMISRLHLLPNQIDQIIELMKKGVENEITSHIISMKNLNESLGKFVVENPTNSPFYEFFADGFPSTFTLEQIADIQERAKLEIKNGVSPACEKLRVYVTEEYKTRPDIAVTSIRNGKTFYDRLIYFHTSTNLTAKQIQDIGFSEVARIEGDMQKVMEELGYGNMSTLVFSNKIREDPRNIHNTSGDLIANYNKIVHKIIFPKLPLLFKFIPTIKLKVQEDPTADVSGAYYRPGLVDGSRPGVFFFYSHNLKSQQKYNMLSLALHEGYPGHHLQSSYSIESPQMPNFRKNSNYDRSGAAPSMYPIYTDFIEGWGLYSEKLGFDMDLYKDPLERYGHYSYEIFRACRLVVDTGLHAFGWTRDQAIQYMLNHTAASKNYIESEVDRYITWPGQALAYKMGQLKISELRVKAETKLGVLFNIKDFHEVILSSAGPLRIAEERVDSYISYALEDSAARLCKDFWDWRLQDTPQFATFIGIHTYDGLLDDMSEAAYQVRYKKSEEFLQRAMALEQTLTDAADIINIRILRRDLESYLKAYHLGGFYFPINFLEGIHEDMVPIFKRMLRNTREDYDKMIIRLQQIPTQINQIIDLLKAGVAKGITTSHFSIKNMNQSIGKFVLDKPSDSPFYEFFADGYPTTINEDEIVEIQTEAKSVIAKEVTPSFDKLRKYITEEYRTRPDIAVTSIHRGKEFYDQAIFHHTSTTMSPQQIHDIGIREVARIEEDMKKVIQETGYGNMSVKEFSNMIRLDPNNYYNTSEEVLEAYKHIVHSLVPPKLPLLFANISSIELDVQGEPSPDGGIAYYRIGARDGSKPSIFYFNSHSPTLQPKYSMLSLSLHEGSPGHHLQVSFALDSKDIPDFRKISDHRFLGAAPFRWPSYTDYKEGWALYAEKLGFELNLYGDSLDRYGHYSEEIFRACRLVVDTGIHALGWTRDQAIQYMVEHTASPKDQLEIEVDRYITWPGQALAYTIGQRKISELRLKTESKLRASFSIKEFHDVILRSSGPLDIVEEEVDKYISRTLRGNVANLCKDYWDWRMKDMPQFATFSGIHIYDHLLDDMSENAYQARYDKCIEFLERVRALEPSLEDEEDVQNVYIIKHELKNYIDSFYLKSFYLQINSQGGYHAEMVSLFQRMPLNTNKDYENMISRLRLIPGQIDQIIDLMKAGVEMGVTFHKLSMNGISELLGKFIVKNSTDSPLYKNFAGEFPSIFLKDQITDIQKTAESAIKNQVTPAFEKLRTYVTEEYITRPDIAATSMFLVKAFYDRLIFYHTSTDYTPEQIHNIGLQEVARIGDEMQKVVQELGHGNMSTKDFSNKIRNDPNNYFNDVKDLISGFHEIVYEVIPPKLSLIFHKSTPPKIMVEEIKQLQGAKAYYNSGSADGSIPGKIQINTFDVQRHPKYSMLSLSMHEANPGHHFQSTYSRETSGCVFEADHRNYGSFPSRFLIYTDYSEGWALYAEKLGFDMNLYGDPLERYGYYSDEIWRACRLVVDTGMHALGWTRAKAIQYLLDHSALTEVDIQVEVDRYITWPGQALAYKMGQMKISELRLKAENQLGTLFDIKDFHDVILGSSMSMNVAEERINKYISKTIENTFKAAMQSDH